jgi:hypothetical protein
MAAEGSALNPFNEIHVCEEDGKVRSIAIGSVFDSVVLGLVTDQRLA